MRKVFRCFLARAFSLDLGISFYALGKCKKRNEIINEIVGSLGAFLSL